MATATSQSMMGGLPSSLLRKPIERPRRLEVVTAETRRLILTTKVDLISPPPPSLMEFEGEDARLTGGTRSLPRRLLALNLYGSLRRTVTRVVPQGQESPVLRGA